MFGDLIDPERTWGVQAYPFPLLSHIMLIAQESDMRTANSPLINIARHALTRYTMLPHSEGDPKGSAPLWVLSEVIADYNREAPDIQGPLNHQDYVQICLDIAQWLRDEQRGMEQIYQLVKRRKREIE